MPKSSTDSSATPHTEASVASRTTPSAELPVIPSAAPPEETLARAEASGSSSLVKAADTFAAFDTVVSVAIVSPDSSPENNEATYSAFRSIRAFCQKCEELFSRTIPTSDISRINRSAGSRTPVRDETAQLILQALPYCKKSSDIFDITMGSVTPLWNFKQGITPSAENLSAAIAHVNWQFVHVFHENDQAYVQLDDTLCALDLGGIAKGWIADEIGALLLRAGFPNHLINLGGNVLAHGKNERGKPWTVQVENPFSNSDEAILVHTADASLVTSGTYQRCFMENGILRHHILNPQTGYPVESDAVSATVVCEKSIDAEGFSTTALALGVREGLAFCADQPEILAAFFIDVNGRVHAHEASCA